MGGHNHPATYHHHCPHSRWRGRSVLPFQWMVLLLVPPPQQTTRPRRRPYQKLAPLRPLRPSKQRKRRHCYCKETIAQTESLLLLQTTLHWRMRHHRLTWFSPLRDPLNLLPCGRQSNIQTHRSSYRQLFHQRQPRHPCSIRRRHGPRNANNDDATDDPTRPVSSKSVSRK